MSGPNSGRSWPRGCAGWPGGAGARTRWRCCAGRSATRRREPSPRRSYRTRRRRARKVAGAEAPPEAAPQGELFPTTTISKRPRSPHCGSCARRVLASGPGRCRRVRPRGRGVANAGPPNTARERRSGSSPAWSDPAADAHAAAGPALSPPPAPEQVEGDLGRQLLALAVDAVVSRFELPALHLHHRPRRRIRGWVRFFLSSYLRSLNPMTSITYCASSADRSARGKAGRPGRPAGGHARLDGRRSAGSPAGRCRRSSR